MSNKEEIRNALSYIDSNDRTTWVRMGAAIKTELGEDGFEIWDSWSESGSSYNSSTAKSTWKSIKPNFINIGSLFYEAKNSGYVHDPKNFTPISNEELEKRQIERERAEIKAREERQQKESIAKDKAQYIWANSNALISHEYLDKKGLDTNLYSDFLKVDRYGNLLIPANQNDEIFALQRIKPNGEKFFGTDSAISGSSFLIGNYEEAEEKGLVLTEGFATGASIYEATGKPVLVVFAAFNLVVVAEKLKNTNFEKIIAADNDVSMTGITYANKAAEVLGDKVHVIEPYFSKEDIETFKSIHGTDNLPSDFNDLHSLKGLNHLESIFSVETLKDVLPMQEQPEYFDNIPDDPMWENHEPTPPSEQTNFIHVDIEASIERNRKVKLIEPEVAIGTPKAKPVPEAATATPEAAPVPEAATATPEVITDLNYKTPPESIAHKYLYAEGGYYDKNGIAVQFSDTGKSLATPKSDRETAFDMVEVAKEKGWSVLQVKGTQAFRRSVYLEAASQGLAVTGYEPTPADKKILEELYNQRALNKVEQAPEAAITPEAATGTPSPEAVTVDNPLVGILIEHGEAPYKNEKENSASYFVTLQNDDGQNRTTWGKDLSRVLNESNIQIGEKVELENLGRTEVTVSVPVKDESGKTVSQKEIDTYRNEWTIRQLAPEAAPVPEAATATPEAAPAPEAATATPEAVLAPEAATATPEAVLAPEATTATPEAVPATKEAVIEQLKQLSASDLESIRASLNNQEEEKEEIKEDHETVIKESDSIKLKSQNESPTKPQIETSMKADTDVDVKIKDISPTGTISSEISIAAKDIKNAKNLDIPNSKKLNFFSKVAAKAVSILNLDNRQTAQRNFNTNMDKAINGTTLNVPEPFLNNGQSLNGSQDQSKSKDQSQAQKEQVRSITQDQSIEMER